MNTKILNFKDLKLKHQESRKEESRKDDSPVLHGVPGQILVYTSSLVN